MRDQLSRRIDAAQVEADAARARVNATLHQIRHRLDPRVLASEAADELFDSVNRLLADTTEAAKARPWAVGLGATVFGLVLALVAKLATGDADETDETDDALDEARQETPASTKPKITGKH